MKFNITCQAIKKTVNKFFSVEDYEKDNNKIANIFKNVGITKLILHKKGIRCKENNRGDCSKCPLSYTIKYVYEKLPIELRKSFLYYLIKNEN